MKSSTQTANSSLKDVQNLKGKKRNNCQKMPLQSGGGGGAKKNVKQLHADIKKEFAEKFCKQEKVWMPLLNKLICENDNVRMKNKSKMTACSKQEMHGIIGKDQDWDNPVLMVECEQEARPGYSKVKANEYHDTPATLKKKVHALANLIRASENAIIYSGAGISTASGIPDYATKAAQSKTIAKRGKKNKGYILPTFSHRTLASMYQNGMFKKWIQQNHDGLPQKAGMPQNGLNEIHGAWHDPSNPVVPMTGTLRSDLYADLEKWEEKADLCVAIGTSLSGMGADCCVHTPAQKFEQAGLGLGSVIIGIQKTQEDVHSSLRIFALIDEVFVLLCHEFEILPTPLIKNPKPKKYSRNIEPVKDVFVVPYDQNGRLSNAGETSFLDLRSGQVRQNLQLTMGPGKGFIGECVGRSPQGHYIIRLPYQREGNKKHGKGKADYKLGSWWIEDLIHGRSKIMPLVNIKQFAMKKNDKIKR